MRTPTIDGGMTGRRKLGAPEAPARAAIAQTDIHAFSPAFVFNFVTRLGLWVSLALLPPLAAAQDLSRILKDRSQARFVKVAENLDDATCAAILKLRIPGANPKFGGIGLMPVSQRYYPMGSLAAHILGGVGKETNGLDGLELRYEKLLAGQHDSAPIRPFSTRHSPPPKMALDMSQSL